MKPELQQMLNDCNAELNDIDAKIKALAALDKTKQYLTNYALMKVCGTVEFVYRSIIADFFAKLACSQIDNYLEQTVRSNSRGAKYETMRSLLGKFDGNWSENFKDLVLLHIDANGNKDGQKLISSSNSLVTNRNLFAHGKTPTASFASIVSYYMDVVILINILDSVVK